MFERYTEKARRVIFFARYEASQFGSPFIETEHLLLGLLREDKALTNRFLHRHDSVEAIRKQIDSRTIIREKVSTTVDLPLSAEGKRVLAYAAEEAERLSHKHIGSEHLLLGLLREENCFAAQLLRERGLEIKSVREDIARSPVDPGRVTRAGNAPDTTSCRDLTQAAMDGELEPVIGREAEVDAVAAILTHRYRRSALLVGERGVGKTAIVEALAQRIAGGEGPLAGKRILALASTPAGGKAGRSVEDLTTLIRSLGDMTADVILFIDDFFGLLAAIAKSRLPSPADVVRHGLLNDQKQCIAACTPGEYNEAIAAGSWLEACFRPVYVRPLDEEATLAVLRARVDGLEKFHEVSYTHEALVFAAHSGGPLPGRALELLDAAGSLARLRQPPPPAEIAEAEKRIRFIVNRMETAIENHEFEKARFYSEEEKKERENLRALSKQHPVEQSAQGSVGPELLEEVLAQWGRYPYTP